MAPMRRKSHGSIRSPHVKRDSQSQVSIEGWLYKLEGGTIKQWKQRWCVLADFCLFLYKGPHEDKVSSSVLLPSYKISPCSTDDRTSKKFSFKAEHQNMKTFYFAAEDKESMKRWMNMMSLATIMQKCSLSDQFDPNFITVGNDDEDSGFTSYRSRRFKSQEHNSTFDNSFGSSEPLKQRSNSYGDRMAEVHLGSDDKYPNVYKSTSSHLYKASPVNQEVPRRQPLYANAPPKPRRLTQSDPYTISPSMRYDAIDHDMSILDSSQYQYDGRLYYSQQQQDQGQVFYQENLPPTVDTSFNDSVFQEAVMHYDGTFSQNSSFQNIPDVHKPQPPRPHSADFLEQHTESFTPVVPVNYCENRQPQRPKSSLECYNRYWDAEEYDFDESYREAVRAQADNLYANKNMNRNQNFSVRQQVEKSANSDQRLNTQYNYPTPNVKQAVSRYESRERMSTSSRERLPSASSENNSYVDPSKPKRSHEESMKRLLEWKQRMLQSPLARRNQGRTNSSSANCSPARPPVPNEYQWQVMQELESYEANLQQRGLCNSTQYDRSRTEHKSRSEGYRHFNNHERPLEVQNHYDRHTQDYVPGQLKEEDRRIVPGMYSSSDNVKDDFEPNKVMYCVDSENNEILFSCDENSVTDQDISKPIHQNHYSPQMHSFSTMSNVNDISNDAHITPESGKHQRSRSLVEKSIKNKCHHNSNHEHQGSNASHPTVITYSSDDEASADSDNRHHLEISKHKYSLRKTNDTIDPEFHAQEPANLRKLVKQSEGLMNKGKRLSVSAGDLLGKTHEELVLLLIQLRRNQSKLLSAKEKCKEQFGDEQQLVKILPTGQKGYSKNYNELLRQVKQLETQYEVTQPLVTLVDNMVKLGSLYGSSDRRSSSCPRLDMPREERTDSAEEIIISDTHGDSSILSKLLAEENNLQRHMTEIYCLDKGLRHETNSISSLQQDKEMLESTLYGMRNKILDHQDRPAELQKLRKQQRMIEKELIRVKKLLSNSAKKIEDASLKNDQLEQEILLLRQRLQQALKTDSSEMKTSQHNRADLEEELTRVQNVLEELANHRHEINNTVEKLKREARSKISKGTEVRASPTGVAGSAALPLRKKHYSMYLETDLDTMITRDLAVVLERDFDDIPVYVNAEEINNTSEDTVLRDLNTSNESLQTYITSADAEFTSHCSLQDINEADERMKRFYGILPKEKPCEIKTVRIVKRQSERRSRERDKKRVTYDDQSSVWVVEEPDISSDDHLDTDEGNSCKVSASPINRPSTISLLASNNQAQLGSRSAHERLFGNTTTKKEKNIASRSLDNIASAKRSKRRHYTVSGYQYMLDPQFSQYFRDRPRSRDDVDMERCLRTANTPDIVRSTIKKKEVFDDKIIERELGLPDKISIPERYIENEPEQLSAGEKLRRSLKAENICKMLSETTTTYGDVVVEERSKSPDALHKKLSEEKKKRAHLLSLNRALAREVVERSKAVAANVYCPESPTPS